MKRLAFAISFATLFSSAPAMADTIRLDSFQFANQNSIAFNITTASVKEASHAGEFTGALNGQSFLTYCVDLLQTFSWGTTYSDYSLASPGANPPSWFTAAKAYDLGRLFTGFNSSVTDFVTSSAFQLATWAIITETGSNYSVMGNGLTATPYYGNTNETLAINTAENWLHSLPGYSNYSVKVEYSSLEQDMIVASKVPEPATYGLLAAGLGLIAASRRRQTVPALA